LFILLFTACADMTSVLVRV